MKTKKVLLLAVIIITIARQSNSQTTIGRQLVDKFPTSAYNTTTYGLTWLPTDYANNTSQKYPLILFLHGSGEGGDGTGGLYNLISQGLPRTISNGFDPEATNPLDGQKYKFIVVSPQAPWAMRWSYGFDVIQYIVADVVNRYRVDPSRIYITGLSAGGSSTLSTVTNGPVFANKIAAIVPICPAGSNSPSEFDQLPLVGGTYGVKVWSPVGATDALLNYTQIAVNAINNGTPAPAVPALLTTLPGVGHEPAAWNTVYEPTWKPSPINLNIYEWMLQYKRSTNLLSANAGANQTITLPTDQVTVNGIGIPANGNTIKSYSWSQTSGPAPVNIISTSSATTIIKGLVSGTYVFKLTVTDNLNATAISEVTILVNPIPNVYPVVNAGNDQAITLPVNTVILNGTAMDSDGMINSYLWTKISGPSSFGMVAPTKPQTSAHSLVEGIYNFELAATDDKGAIAKDTVMVTVHAAANKPPNISAGIDQAIKLPLDSVMLMGMATDSDGTIASYSWKKIMGPENYLFSNATTPYTSVSRLIAGIYLFELSVTDNNGATARDSMQVKVNPADVIVGGCQGIRRVMLPGGDGGKYINSDPSGIWFQQVNPGDTLVLQSKIPYSYFAMEGYSGTGACPIVLINEGGQVWLTQGLKAKDCRNLKITGTGAANAYYGFKIFNPEEDQNGVAICITGKSSVVEVERVDVYKKTYGVWAKQDPMCDTLYNYPNYIMDSIEIHHSRFKNIGQDCIYAGNTDPLGQREISCGGSKRHYIPMRMSNVNIHHLIIDSCNRTGIQLSGASGGYNQIHNNIITRCGYEYNQWQGTGIAIGGMTRNCHVFNNTIKNTYLYGIISFGAGTNYIENNTVDSSGYLDGVPNRISQPSNILVSPKETIPFDSTTIIIRNNRLGQNAAMDSTNVAVLLWGPPTWTKDNIVCNNTKLSNNTPALVYVDPSVQYIKNCNVNLPNIPPVAFSGDDQLITSTTIDSALVSGSGTDIDGTVVSFKWSHVSGPMQFTISNADQANTSITNLKPGEYTFRLTVTDNDGATATDDIVIRFLSPNKVPIANAGPDQIIVLPVNLVTLTGSGLDYDGSISSYNWRKIDGPSSYTMSTSTNSVTTVGNLSEGFYYFELRVTDNLGAMASDTVMIRLNAAPPASNRPPVANAGADQTITLPTDLVSLTGSGTDADGKIEAYEWSQSSGPASFTFNSNTKSNVVVSTLVEGTYQFVLKVTDDLGSVGRDTVMIKVLPTPNRAPVASAGPDKVITLPINSVTILGSATDADGTVTTYKWSKISGPSSFTIVNFAQPQTIVNGLVKGVYQFELRVADNQGAMDVDTVLVTVNSLPNASPIANAGLNQEITLPVNSITLNGSGTDADGNINSYLWTKISGPASSNIVSPNQAQTIVKELGQGTYIFVLTVKDNMGAMGKDSIVVTVHAANQPPKVNAGNNQVIQLPVNAVTLTGSATDADGSIVVYQWTKISGPAQFELETPTKPNTSFHHLTQGIYLVELSVTDNNGATGKDTVMITVNAINIPPVANAGPDQVITLPVNVITLKGMASDADGTVASSQWSKISGPVSGNITNMNSIQSEVKPLTQGIYKFELKVTDNQGASSRDTLQVVVNAQPPVITINIAPVAYAGADTSITLPINEITLFGKGVDSDGTIIAYNWTMISGPLRYKIHTPTQARTLVSNLEEGDYKLEITVTDNKGARGKDTMTITVKPDMRTRSVASIYPNPAQSKIYIKIDAITQMNNTHVRIYNVGGALVYQEDFLRSQQVVEKQINILNFKSGVYILVVNVDINTNYTIKFVKD